MRANEPPVAGEKKTDVAIEKFLFRFTTAPIVTCVLVALLPVTLLDSSELTSSAALPFVVILGWASVHLVYSANLGRRGLPILVFWLFVYVWFGLAPLLQLSSRVLPLPLPLSGDDFQRAGVILLVGLIAHDVAYFSRRAASSNRARRVRIPRPLPILRILCGACLAISLASAYLVGFKTYLTSRQALNESLYAAGSADNSLGALVSALAITPVFVAATVMLIAQKNQRDQWGRLDSSVLVLLLVANMLINNPISQSRFWFTTVWGTLLVVALWKKSSIFRAAPTILLVAILFVFPFSDVFRYSDPAEQTFAFSGPSYTLVTKGDFDSAEQVAWGARVADTLGYGDGKQAFGAALFWLPRRFFEDKPFDTGIVLARQANLGNTSVSAPLWVEGYYDGGFGLLVLYFVVLGLVHANIAARLSGSFVPLGVFFIFYQLVILRGSLIASMAGSAALLVVAFGLTRTQRASAS